MPPVVLFVAEVVVDSLVYLGASAEFAAVVGNFIIDYGASIIGSLASMASSSLGQAIGAGAAPAAKYTFSVRQPITTHKVIVGQMKVGGAMTFIDTTPDNSTLFLVLTLTGHPVFSIDGIFLNDTYVPLNPTTGQAEEPIVWPDGTKPTNYTNHCQVYKGLGTVNGDAAMIAALILASEKWGPNFAQNSRGKIYIRLGWDTNLFGSTGVPNVAAVVRGRMIYDPRNTGTAIVTSSPGTPSLFTTATNHNLVPGQMAFIKDHSGAIPVSAPFWPAAQRNAVAQEYEVATTPSANTFTLYGIDSQALALTTGGSGGTITAMQWTDNSLLVLRDYLVEPVHGLGSIYDSETPEGLDITGANICDEVVPRVLPTTTFIVNPGSNQIIYTENQASGPLPPLCQVMVSSTGTLPGGLSANTPYFFAQEGGGPVGVLCVSSENATENPPRGVNFTSDGSGTMTITIVESLTPDVEKSSLAVYDNALRICTGNEVLLSNVGGTPPTGLAPGNYWAIFLADNVVQLASSFENARLGIPIVFTDNGSGTSFISVVSEVRFTCNGVLDTGDTRQNLITGMLTSMGGYLVPSGPSLNLYPAAYLTPTVALDEGDLRGPMQLTALMSGAQSFNSVKGTFIDPFNRGQPTDYPQQQNTTYIAQDNFEVVWRDLTLAYTNSSSMAQRLAKIELERIRRELTVTMPLKLTAFQVGSPDVIYINNTMLGWASETFEVSSWRFSISQTNGAPTLDVDVVARQTDAAVYAWTAAEEAAAKRQSNTNLPNPFVVAPPTGLTLASGGVLIIQQQDGTLVSRIQVGWTSPVDQFVLNGGFIEIWFKKSSDTAWIAGETVPGDQTIGYIENAEIGVDYDVSIRSRNAIGGVSDIAPPPFETVIFGYLVVGKSNAPSDISSIIVTVNGLSVTLAGTPIPDTDVVAYEYRYGAGAVWAGMTMIEQAAAVPNGSGGVAGACTSGNIPTGTWFFAVKAINRSGIYSINAAFSSDIGITNILPNGSIPGGYITAAMFASSIQPILIVASLGFTGSYVGQVVVLTSDQQLYRWTGSIWTADVPVVNLSGQITTSQITPNAITTPLLAANAVTAAQIAANTITSGNIAANAIQAGQLAVGAVNASFIIVDDIIVTGHLTTNAVTDSNYAQAGSQTINNSSAGMLVNVNYTTDGGTVLIQFTDYFVRSNSHSPTVQYTIVIDGSTVETINSGGSSESFNIVTAMNYLATGLSAGAHSFAVYGYCGLSGGDPSCLSEAATIITSELKDQN